MFYVYILKSTKDGNIYIGKTNDVDRRIKEHNSGHTPSLKSRIPMVLLEKIACKDEGEALKLEKELKKGYNRESIKRKFN